MTQEDPLTGLKITKSLGSLVLKNSEICNKNKKSDVNYDMGEKPASPSCFQLLSSTPISCSLLITQKTPCHKTPFLLKESRNHWRKYWKTR